MDSVEMRRAGYDFAVAHADSEGITLPEFFEGGPYALAEQLKIDTLWTVL